MAKKIVYIPDDSVSLASIVEWMNRADFRSHRIEDAAKHFDVSKSGLGQALWRHGYYHSCGRWFKKQQP